MVRQTPRHLSAPYQSPRLREDLELPTTYNGLVSEPGLWCHNEEQSHRIGRDSRPTSPLNTSRIGNRILLALGIDVPKDHGSPSYSVREATTVIQDHHLQRRSRRWKHHRTVRS